jgi:hypothetical protein
MVGMVQFEDPWAVPNAPLVAFQYTCTDPVPPETVPLMEMGVEGAVLGGAITASSSGLDAVGVGEGSGPGAGAGLGLAEASAAAYNSCAAAMSLGIRTVCIR